MGVDWIKVKNEYISTGISTRKLAEKYGISASSVMKKAAAEKWASQRKEQKSRIEAELKRKTASSVAASEADRLSTLVRIGEKAARFLEGRLDVLIAVGAKSYEVKAIMETVKLIREVYDSGPRTSEDDPLLAYLERLKNDG